MLRSYCFGNGSTTVDGLKNNLIPPRFRRADVRIQHEPRAWQEENKAGKLRRKNQTDTGRVSRYTSLLQRNNFFYFLRLLTARQAVNFSLKLAQLPDTFASRKF
jgi:hypothetical protein